MSGGVIKIKQIVLLFLNSDTTVHFRKEHKKAGVKNS